MMIASSVRRFTALLVAMLTLALTGGVEASAAQADPHAKIVETGKAMLATPERACKRPCVPVDGTADAGVDPAPAAKLEAATMQAVLTWGEERAVAAAHAVFKEARAPPASAG